MMRRAVLALAVAALAVPAGAGAALAHDRGHDHGRRWVESSCWRGHHERHTRPGRTPTSPTSSPSTPPETIPPRPTPGDTTTGTISPAPTAQLPADRLNASFTDRSGTASTYHLFTSKVTGPVRGLVVYLDGDGMYGHRNPSTTWALGGASGVIAQAGKRGYPTLSIATPSRDGTFWTAGSRNADYVADLIQSIRAQIGVEQTWLVSYSGGSQLVTKFLIPAHSSTFAVRGGAVILGGGGRPAGTPNIDPALKAGFPMHWYTGDIDDGRNTSDRYNAIRDARAGHAWYTDRGYAATIETPAGVDHGDLGGRFGTVLAEQLDARG